MPYLRAAQYQRMSTEHQKYSIEGQTLGNAAYAAEHGYEIVRTYRDEGISGLTLAGRTGLKALLADVLGGEPGYDVVLVYDVSRWGRFQDPDQGAHYEFVCREAGVRIEYTGEAFANDGSLTSTLVKSIKRAMAAEYSRELSAKVAAAKRGWAAKGYWVGGSPGFGLRRQIVSPDGVLGPQMGPGERKALQGQRVILTLGPDHEVATVRRIFRMYVVEGLRPFAIAERLNGEGVQLEDRRPWCDHRVRQLLSNERYVGVLVSGRIKCVLKQQRPRPREEWTRAENALPAIIDRPLFDLVQANLRQKPKTTDEGLLDELRALLAREGRLTQRLIKDDTGTRDLTTYMRRLGSMLQIYERLDYRPSPRQLVKINPERYWRPTPRDRKLRLIRSLDELLADLRRLFAERGWLSSNLIDDAPYCACAATYRRLFGGMRRAYALVGYRPTPWQEEQLERAGQSLTAAQAATLREQVLAAQQARDGR